MPEQQAQGMAQRLQDIREGLGVLLSTHEGEPESLETIGMAYQMLDQLETQAPEEVDTQMLSLLEELIQGGNASDADKPTESLTFHEEGMAYFEKFQRWGDLNDLERAVASWQRVVDMTLDSHSNLPSHLSNLGAALQTRFEQVGSLADLEAALSQTRKAVDLTPDGHPDKPGRLNNLGSALETRFDRHGSLPDLEEAIVQKRKAVDLTPDNHPDRPMFLNNLGSALNTRFERHGSLIDLDEAILQMQKAINLTPDSHLSKHMCLNNLGIALQTRFDRQGSLADLEEAILQKQKAVDLIPDGHPNKSTCLSNLGSALDARFGRSGSLTDLEEALLQQQDAVNLTPEGHPDKPSRLNNLGNTLERKFQLQGMPPDLDGSILHRQKAIQLIPDGHPDRIVCLSNLGRALRIRFKLLGDHNDLQGALSAARESAEFPAASSVIRLENALSWAACCRLGSTSSLPALECAIELLPRIAWLGISVDDQYFLLAEAGSTARMAVESAIVEGENARAIEWAEQGRAIVWQNLLSLRTPLDELRGQYPELASRLQELSQCLERAAKTSGASDGSKASNTPEDQMKIAMERDSLIEEVRRRAGFGSFMKPKSLAELALAVRDRPVVFLNLGLRRCDALALLSENDGTPRVVSIPLERVTFQKAEKLSKKLVEILSRTGVRARDIRKHKIHGVSDDNDTIFKEILQTLWLDYVKPVVDALAYSVNLDSPPRLWWCTTGPLAFLPLHAAGLYDAQGAGHKLSDYVVSSYTPTLAALLNESPPVSSQELKILTVAISNTPGAPLPCTEEEAQRLRRVAANVPVVSIVNEEATQERVLEELKENTWVHLACHGEQVGGKPMESGLVLHDGKLKLSTIVKARLPNADFAFLSACQTAVGDGGVPEESAHMAAGMLFAGYHGVVATMWSIQDDIAPRVADDFYRYMFRHGKPKREEAAYALQTAIRSLQESGVPFASWVPFIHIGR